MEINNGFIYSSENCIACNKCIISCPVNGANIALGEKDGCHIVVDSEKCIHCGECVRVCEHSSRHCRDDIALLFEALSRGEKIDLLIDPSFFFVYKGISENYIGFLRTLGFEHIYNVGVGANIANYAYYRYISDTDKTGLITSSCPSVVDYIEKYQPALIDRLVPIKSPVHCLRTYLHIKESNPEKKYAYLSLCPGNWGELSESGKLEVIDYPVTFASFTKYILQNTVNFENYHGEVDYLCDCELGSFSAVSGGIKEILSSCLGSHKYIKTIDGVDSAYSYLDKYVQKAKSGERLPFLLEINNCKDGCISGYASGQDYTDSEEICIDMMEILSEKRKKISDYFDSTEAFLSDARISYSDFFRSFNTESSKIDSEVSETIIDSVFKRMHKDSIESRTINCSSCGYKSCRDMAVAIARGYNRPENCIHYVKNALTSQQNGLNALITQIYGRNSISTENRKSELIVQSLSDAFKNLELEKEKLLNENLAKTKFFASMTHELRTPLNAILNMADAIKEQLIKTASEDNIDNVNNIINSGQNLLETINELLDMSKLDSGKFTIVDAAYDIAPLLSDVGTVISFRATEKKLQFTMLTDPSLPKELIGDSKRIRQILINLLSNAVKYTPSGEVTLRTTWNNNADAPVITFDISDTGIGIREEDIPFLFQAYSQVDVAKNHNIEGTGLGLSISDALSKEMNGEISVKSTYGSGSTFTLTLPQKINAYTPLNETDLMKSPAIKEKNADFVMPGASILLVDDMSVNQRIAAAFLEDLQAHIAIASSGQEALDLCEKEHFDVILMDYQMPIMNGIETIERLRASNSPSKDAPIIIMTSEDSMEFAENGAGYLFQGYVGKPVDKMALIAEVGANVPDSLKFPISTDTLPQKEYFTKAAEEGRFEDYLSAAAAMERVAKRLGETQIGHLTRSHRTAIQSGNEDFVRRNARFLDAHLELLRSLL